MSRAFTTCCFLPVGNYNLTAETQGFKKTVLGPFDLQVNQIARVDIRLEVGDTTQSVEIRDFAPVLQTESTATGDTLEGAKLTSIPLNGRNYASLLQLMPGAISTAPASHEYIWTVPGLGQPSPGERQSRTDE